MMNNRILLLLLILPVAFSCAKKSVDTARVPKSPDEGGYVVEEGSVQIGIASWYGIDEHNNYAASGERFSKYAYTAAHKTLPLGTVVRVTNLENGRDVIVEVNDRGPFVKGRIIDLSHAPAEAIDMIQKGTVKVKVEVVSSPSVRSTSYFDPHYTVQVGSFSDRGNAVFLKRQLDPDYDDVRVENVKLSGSEYFRVRVGRFSDESEAERTAFRLRRLGLTSRVLLE